MFLTISIIGILMLIPMGTFAFKENIAILGILDFLLATILILNILHIRYSKDLSRNIYLGIICAALLFIFAFLFGGTNNSAFVWYFTFPLIASFLLGPKKGAIASGLLLIPAFALFMVKDLPSFFANYSMALKLRFTGAYIVIASFSYFFESMRDKNTRELQKARDELEERVQTRTAELHTLNREMEKGLSETFDALKKISSGDPTVRVSENSAIDLIRELKITVNMTAKGIGEIVDQSHEIAIGLAEQFDVLYKVSQGDMDAKVEGQYRTELTESLKKVTNEMIKKITLSQRALQESEEKYSSLFRNSNDAIFVHDLEGNIIDINERVSGLFGYTREEILSLNILTLHSSETYDKFKKSLNKISLKASLSFEVDFRKKNGEVFPAEVSVSLFEMSGSKTIQTMVRDITERKQAIEQISYMAYHDILTNLPNRHLMKDRLKQALSSAQQYDRIVAILFLDLDNFKHINDTFGHDIGDLLLQEVAERLLKYIRKSDSIARLDSGQIEPTVARLGGDEFTILLTEINDVGDAAKVAQRILELFDEPFFIQNHSMHISTSIGISLYPHDGDNAETLLKNADTAMYHSKAEGKNNCQFYKEPMNVAIFEKISMEKQLKTALKLKEFELYYQPQVDIQSWKIIGAEALVRWHHPEKGLLLPKTFIPIAEETGLMIPIGEWILYTACAQNRAWQDAGVSPIRVTVNLSGVQFRQANFIATVDKILKDTGLDPKYLEFEITESILMENMEDVIADLNTLKSMGIHISIDDFGTGYSSLSYLNRFPIDTLKIDQSFVQDIKTDNDDLAVIKAIIALAGSLKLKVIAEGVETVEQLSFLHKQGSDMIQGFLFSPPLPTGKFAGFLNETKECNDLSVSMQKINNCICD